MIEGRTPKTNPSGGGVEAFVPKPHPIKPLGGPFRRWHLTPWKRTEATALLDDLDGSNLGEDDEEGETSGLDILNNLVTQAGNVWGSRNGMVVPRPRPGQMVPAGSGTMLGGMSTNTMLLIGGGLVALLLVPKLLKGR